MEDANTAAITSNGVNTDYQVVNRSLSFVQKSLVQNHVLEEAIVYQAIFTSSAAEFKST